MVGSQNSENRDRRLSVLKQVVPSQRLNRDQGQSDTDAYGISDFGNPNIALTIDDAIDQAQ